MAFTINQEEILNDFENILDVICIFIITILGLYISARVITRAVMRSIDEWKERKQNGQEKDRYLCNR